MRHEVVWLHAEEREEGKGLQETIIPKIGLVQSIKILLTSSWVLTSAFDANNVLTTLKCPLDEALKSGVDPC